MWRVVLDSNVLVSAFATPYGAAGQIFDAWQERRFALVTSDYILNEVARILEIKIGLDPEFILHRIAQCYSLAEVVEPTPIMHPRIDANDLPILGTALAGMADVVVTGDHALLAIERFRRIPILSLRVFLDSLT